MEMSNPEDTPKTPAENLKGTSATDATELEDPFDDPALVTNAFLDIMWQDADGNSALMLAAAENRMLHVKGILTMAAQRGTLWQVLDMRNDNGLSALEMALRSGSDTCAMLITRFAKEYQKTRPRFRRMSFTRRGSNEASETDIMIEFDDAPPAAVPFLGLLHGGGGLKKDIIINWYPVKPRIHKGKVYQSVASRRPFILNPPPRRLSRDKISNHLKRIPPNDCTREMNRAGRPPPPNKWVQRTISNDSQSSLPSPSSSAASPVENKSISVGDKLRSIFSSRRVFGLQFDWI
ncbi:unnamed protein product [Haemonchus placei]|uniref:ANK_REP_REGION domain-containing protein n=1 Tax=Haemonchus placei TaxID=6290 RepID=A0A158QQ04_HAEPC|nr:unnamed protein product [Haemonchus placei]